MLLSGMHARQTIDPVFVKAQRVMSAMGIHSLPEAAFDPPDH